MEHKYLRWDLSQHKKPITSTEVTSGSVIVPSWDSITGNPIAVNFVVGGSGETIIESVFGRTGIIVAETGDYTAEQVGAVPISRTITINGTTYDLSADRSWTISSSGSSSLDDLTDVTITSVTSGNLLRYSGTAWVNAILSSSDIPNLDMSKITTGNLSWSRITSTPTTLLGYNITDAVASARTITINGITYDLSANRTWTVGDLLSSSTYSNPSWITSLAWSKITGAPSFITSASVATLTDVTLTSLTTGNFLRYNGSAWVNTLLAMSDLGSGTASSSTWLRGDGTWQPSTAIVSPATSVTAMNSFGLSSVVGVSTNFAREDHVHSTPSPTKSDVGLSNVDNTSDLNKPISTATQTALDLKQSLSEKGNPLGYASLDSGGKVPASQLPSSVMELQGSWNASTNTPTLADGVGNSGDVYEVTVAGTVDLGSGSITFAVGDWVVYGASAIWHRSANSNDVTSVNGYTGTVVLTTASISDSTDKRYVTDANLVVIGNTSNTNTGDETTATIKTKLGAATTSLDGYLTSTDWNTFNNKLSTSRTIATTAPLSGGGDLTSDRTISISQSSTSTDGYLSSTDWNIFNNKLSSTWTGSTNIVTLGTITTGVWNGTRLSITYGGTGATTASGARTSLGLAIGTDVQAYDADLDAISSLSATGYAKRTGTNTWSLSTSVPWTDIGSTPTTISGYGITDSSSVRMFKGNAHVLSTSTYTGLKAWRTERDSSNLWCLAPQALGINAIETIANAKTTSPGNKTRTNDTKVSSSDFGVTTANGLTVSLDTTSTYDYNTSVQTAPYQYSLLPAYVGQRLRPGANVVARVQYTGAMTGTGLFGIIVIRDSAITNYMRLLVGSNSSAAAGYSEWNTSGVAFSPTALQLSTGVWIRIIYNYEGSLTSQWSASPSSTPPTTGWTTIQTSSTSLMPLGGAVRVGMLQLRASSGTPSPLVGTYLYYDDSSMVSETYGDSQPMGLGAPTTRSNTKSPIILIDTGKTTSTCSSIADLRSSITAACNRRPYDTSTLRFSYQTYSSLGSVSAPADGDASWVALSSINSLAAPSAGAVHVLWVDASSTNGIQSASIDLNALTLLISC